MNTVDKGKISNVDLLNKEILCIFDDKYDIDNLKEILSINVGNIPIGMTTFQIENFVLNRREFPSDLMQFQQAKAELFSRIQTFVDLYYQHREAKAKIKLAEGKIDDLKNNINTDNTNNKYNPKIKEAKIELQEIEIEKYLFRLRTIQHTAKEKLREANVFYKTYKKFEKFEHLDSKEIDVLEEEGWKIKSFYYPELPKRYNLTPNGFIRYPHENGGLDLLLEMINQISAPIKNDNTSNNKIEKIEEYK